MRIVVMGAGVVGICSAYYLARSGHDVVVVERNAEAAAEASWGNAGVITPSQAYSMASPRIWSMVRKSLFSKAGPLKFRFPPELRLLPWMAEFCTYCTEARSRELTRKKFILSQEALGLYREIVDETKIRFDDHVSGSINVFANEQALEASWAASAVLREEGLTLERLDRDSLLAAEPILANDIGNIHGALRSRIDWSGNPALFTRRLLRWLEDNHRVEVRFKTNITGFEVRSKAIRYAVTDAGKIEADAFVLATGAYAPRLTRRLGLRLPIYPVKGYSITIPSAADIPNLNSSVIDSSRRLAISRLGSSIRVTFRAEFGGYDTSVDKVACQVPVDYVKGLFGKSLDYDAAHYWAGFRPMTPNGLPIVGPTGLSNLFLNAGHGHLGWTMAPATSKAMTEALDQWGRMAA
ncbi:MAG: FAD-dependent oxidoreductase [Methylobacterium sp.]|nr:FAD-dependent oxidoreductase [Methylobacterium sp.]MCA3619833.1 FAD-dependent oxidoreductase [Methylobacterium sp.]